MQTPSKWYDSASVQAFIGCGIVVGLFSLGVISIVAVALLLAALSILLQTVHADHQQKEIDRLARAIDRLERNIALDEHNRQRRGIGG
jgi:hypothetical protein